jgi:predicted nuclease with TOPRIM domain
MPRVISLNDGKVETLFNPQDFEYLLERYMGYESVQYFRELIAEKDTALEELREEYEGKLDTLRDKYRELEDELEERETKP